MTQQVKDAVLKAVEAAAKSTKRPLPDQADPAEDQAEDTNRATGTK